MRIRKDENNHFCIVIESDRIITSVLNIHYSKRHTLYTVGRCIISAFVGINNLSVSSVYFYLSRSQCLAMPDVMLACRRVRNVNVNMFSAVAEQGGGG